MNPDPTASAVAAADAQAPASLLHRRCLSVRGAGGNQVKPPARAGAPAGTLSQREFANIEGIVTTSPALLWVGAANAAAPTANTVCTETWCAGPVQRTGTQGHLQFATDGTWLYASGSIEDAHFDSGLEAAAHRLYADLFTLLNTQPCRHLARLWNYVPRINEVTTTALGQALERYRQFNIGRQRAFLEAGHSAFVGAPAACALGTAGGALTVHALAGVHPVQPIENPRQISAYHYPRDYGPSSPTFSRAALASIGNQQEALFVSGTASIVGHVTCHVGDVAAQTGETLANIAAVIAASQSAARSPHDPSQLDYTIYVRHAADLPRVQSVFERTLGPHSPAVQNALYLRADICRADLLVEIEAQGVASAGLPHHALHSWHG